MTSTTTLTLTFFRGRKGDVISRLPSGKVVLPARGFQPRAGEEWEVEIFERERVAIAHPLHRIVEKERLVLKKFKCGHTMPAWTETVKVPEHVEPEPRVRDVIEPEVCEECKKKCQHSDLEFSMSDFWVAVICKDCGSSVWETDLSVLEDADRALAEITERFPRIAEEAEKRLTEWKEWASEYREKSREHRKVRNTIRELRDRIRELIGRDLDNFHIDTEKQEVIWCEYHQFAPEEPYNAVEMRAPLPEEHTDEILQLWSKVVELEKTANELHWWLTENRPVE